MILPTTTTTTTTTRHTDTEKKDGNNNTIILCENNKSSKNQKDDTSCCLGREMMEQQVGKLRVKSGISNIQSQNRSTSMSCSDNLCRYQLFGYQGTLLQH